MKKIYSLLIVAIMTVSATFAQNLGGPYYPSRLDSYDLYYGFRIGYNASSLHFNTDAIDNTSVSSQVFLSVTLPSSSNLEFSTASKEENLQTGQSGVKCACTRLNFL